MKTFANQNLLFLSFQVKLDQFKIELWPGYITSIRQHEQDILVCCEVSHKVCPQIPSQFSSKFHNFFIQGHATGNDLRNSPHMPRR